MRSVSPMRISIGGSAPPPGTGAVSDLRLRALVSLAVTVAARPVCLAGKGVIHRAPPMALSASFKSLPTVGLLRITPRPAACHRAAQASQARRLAASFSCNRVKHSTPLRTAKAATAPALPSARSAASQAAAPPGPSRRPRKREARREHPRAHPASPPRRPPGRGTCARSCDRPGQGNVREIACGLFVSMLRNNAIMAPRPLCQRKTVLALSSPRSRSRALR